MTTLELPEPTPAPSVEAFCVDRYYADQRDRYAFTFQIVETGTRFTVYTADGEHFHTGGTYRMLITRQDTITLAMSIEEGEFLRTCLHNTAHRWREAIAEADAGATRPPRPSTPPDTEPGTIDVEPTPAGYHTAARWFRDELAKVERLLTLVDTQLRHASNPDDRR